MIVSETNYTDKDLLSFLGSQESQFVAWGNEYTDELVQYLANGHELVGAKLPWEKTHSEYRMRAGEVTIWAGMNGHRKSMVLGQVMAWVANQGQRVGVMSFEMPVRDTMKRMLQQCSGSYTPAAQYARDWAGWNHERICYYDKLDTTPASKVLGTVFHMAKNLGCKQIMIDSLTKCGLPYGERGAEKDFIDALCATAKAFQIHIHLVCHVRKPHSGGEEYIPTKFDIRGAGELTDLVHNVIVCWADKKKAQLRKLNRPLDAKETEYMRRPDQRLIIAKQRNGAFEGTIGLWMQDCLQFTGEDSKRVMPFHFGPKELAA